MEKNVLDAFLWLKNNNLLYKDVSVDMTHNNSLPEDCQIKIQTKT